MRLAKTVLTRLIASTDFPFSVEAIYFAMKEHVLEIMAVIPLVHTAAHLHCTKRSAAQVLRRASLV